MYDRATLSRFGCLCKPLCFLTQSGTTVEISEVFYRESRNSLPIRPCLDNDKSEFAQPQASDPDATGTWHCYALLWATFAAPQSSPTVYKSRPLHYGLCAFSNFAAVDTSLVGASLLLVYRILGSNASPQCPKTAIHGRSMRHVQKARQLTNDGAPLTPKGQVTQCFSSRIK